MIDLQSDNNVFLSLIITLVIIAVLGVGYVSFRYRSYLKRGTDRIQRRLGGSAGVMLFTATRILVGVVGLGVLIATVLPGLMPFRSYVNHNLELGGLLFFFIWPFIATQIAAAFIPYSKKWIAANPISAWIILLTIGCILLSIDVMAMNLMYDFSSRQ